jgi:hypothetical protein
MIEHFKHKSFPWFIDLKSIIPVFLPCRKKKKQEVSILKSRIDFIQLNGGGHAHHHAGNNSTQNLTI